MPAMMRRTQFFQEIPLALGRHSMYSGASSAELEDVYSTIHVRMYIAFSRADCFCPQNVPNWLIWLILGAYAFAITVKFNQFSVDVFSTVFI